MKTVRNDCIIQTIWIYEKSVIYRGEADGEKYFD